VKSYVINLASRPDKLTLFRQNQFPLDIERFEGIIDMPRDNGCAKSHLAILAMEHEFPFATFEDDCVMLENWMVVQRAMAELPDDWSALWLGATLTTPLERYSDHLFRLKRAHCLHAVIYNSQEMVDYILNHHDFKRHQYIDVFMFEVQQKFNCFVTYPICATQRIGFSDISQKHVDYHDYIIDCYNKNTHG
jgi:GR25 family glycosyltransferase involved in LPS biosynthesis